jgi:adenine-specific DNA-methyltransferase
MAEPLADQVLRKIGEARELCEAQDGIDRRRDELIEQIERQLQQTHETTHLLTVRWTMQ